MSCSRWNRCASYTVRVRSALSRTGSTPFMGATDPSRMQESGKQVAGLLQKDRVDIALLVPV